MRIAVLGAAGQLGRDLTPRLQGIALTRLQGDPREVFLPSADTILRLLRA